MTVAVVTGAASGIGRSVAGRFGQAGAKVAMLDCDQERGRRACSELQAMGYACEYYCVDVSKEEQVTAAIANVSARFGQVTCLVNNAGIVLVRDVEACSVAEWDRVFDVNVKSIFLMVKHCVPSLRRSKGASIVNVSSVSGLVAQKGTPAYVASKGAVLMLSKALALDLAADGIRVNCVCPGITDTPMLRSHANATPDAALTLRQRTSRVPMGRMLSPDEIADAVFYLASGGASGVTGTELLIDGGYLATAEWP